MQTPTSDDEEITLDQAKEKTKELQKIADGMCEFFDRITPVNEDEEIQPEPSTRNLQIISGDEVTIQPDPNANANTRKLRTIQIVNSIICTCISGIIAVSVQIYLLLGNLSFKFIIPFCEPAQYVFMGFRGLVFGLAVVISGTRFHSIFLHSKNGGKNTNFLASIFYPFVQQLGEEKQPIEKDL
jgi:hypothetical protein